MSYLRVPLAASSAALVRHRMTADLGRTFPDDVLDAAALVVSELVGNAVRHGVALPGGGLLASWDVVDRALRVQVVDGGSGPAGPVPPAAPDDESGRGLALVEALTSRWGSRPASGGTAVWAELATESGQGRAADRRLAGGPPTREEFAISARRRPPARPTGAPSPVATRSGAGRAEDVPVVGGREPCPCGSGKRYKACHGRPERTAFVSRPFAGRVDETEWVALREVVPAATAPLRVLTAPDRDVVLSTVLPLAWPAMVRADGRILLGLQVPARSGDASRDLANALVQALASPYGTSVVPVGLPGPGPRLQDLLAPEPLEVTVHAGFDYWVEGAADPTGEVAASLERANSSVVPTVRLTSVPSAYWCRMRERAHLRWVLPEDEEPLLDALARVAVDGGLSIGEDTRYIGCFRAHGLLVPVWDLPPDTEAAACEQPTAALRARLSEVLAAPRQLSGAERRARAGLLSRQLTLR